MLVKNFEMWQLWIIAGMIIVSIAIGFIIRSLILKCKAVLTDFFVIGLIIVYLALVIMAIRIWPNISYLSLTAGIIGFVVGLIRINK